MPQIPSPATSLHVEQINDQALIGANSDADLLTDLAIAQSNFSRPQHFDPPPYSPHYETPWLCGTQSQQPISFDMPSTIGEAAPDSIASTIWTPSVAGTFDSANQPGMYACYISNVEFPMPPEESLALVHGTVQQRWSRKARAADQIYTCGWNGCQKAYVTLRGLNVHVEQQLHGMRRIADEFNDIIAELEAKKNDEDCQRESKDLRPRQELLRDSNLWGSSVMQMHSQCLPCGPDSVQKSAPPHYTDDGLANRVLSPPAGPTRQHCGRPSIGYTNRVTDNGDGYTLARYNTYGALDDESNPTSCPVSRRKRIRAIEACVRCRRRKLKCDEGYPCSSCKGNDASCLYRNTSPAKIDKVVEKLLDHAKLQSAGLSKLKAEIDSLKARLHNAEQGTHRRMSPTAGSHRETS